jgi:UDP-2,3-diacylglucosamine hydrolase
VAAYFASDVHLRLDRPDRALRFARFVDRLGPDDPLVLAGDLCDFWFASRQRPAGFGDCPGLRALAAFRERGGRLTIMAGNHDLWLGPFYERALGVGLTPEPLEVEAHGLRVHLVHGHRLGARPLWKAGMESRAFLETFARLPGPLARRLGAVLDRTNVRGRADDERRHLAVFRDYAGRLAASADLAVFGHIHTAQDDPASRPRLVVLGGWHEQSSYLKIDAEGPRLIVEPDPG